MIFTDRKQATVHTPAQPIVRPKDERRGIRRLTNATVRCNCGSHSWEAYLANISPSGAFVESNQIPQIGKTINMEFTLPFPKKGIQVRFNLKGQIIRTEGLNGGEDYLTPQGFCTRFIDLNEKEQICLQNFATDILGA